MFLCSKSESGKSLIFRLVGTYRNRLKPLREVDLDVSVWREVDIDVFGFLGLLSGQFRCFLDNKSLCGQY